MKQKMQIIIGVPAAFVLAISAMAQDTATVQTDRADTSAQRPDRAASPAKASDVIGMAVVNKQNEKLGKVKDILVDLESGRIVEVIVSPGGFLGMGETLVAVPPEALRCGAASKVLCLDTTKERLKDAPKFDAANAAQYCDANRQTEVYRYYGAEPAYPLGQRNSAGVTVYSTTRGTTDADNTARNARDRDDRTLTPVNQGNSQADIDTTAQIRKDIIATKDLSIDARNVKVITLDGHVTLRGPVNTAEEKRVIGEIAERIAPSGKVNNQLEVKLTANN
jgi:hyperosmotically inducible periplasmic protein